MKEAEKHVRVVNDYAETDSNFLMASHWLQTDYADTQSSNIAIEYLHKTTKYFAKSF